MVVRDMTYEKEQCRTGTDPIDGRVRRDYHLSNARMHVSAAPFGFFYARVRYAHPGCGYLLRYPGILPGILLDFSFLPI